MWKKVISLLLIVCLLSTLVSCSGGNPVVPPDDEESSSEGYAVNVTDSSGKTSIVMENKQVNINVKDEYGVPIPSVTVKAYALGEDVLIFAGNEDYLPGIKILTASEFSSSGSFGLSKLKPKIAVIAITLMVLYIAGIAMTVYEYYNNPGEFPVQIPGLIEGEKKVESACFQIDGNDVTSIGSAILSGLALFKGVQVLGAPAQLRGVTAINYGFTKNMVTSTGAKMIGTAFVKLAGILDTDIINTCTYKYETNNGYEEMPYLTFDVQRSSTNEEEDGTYALRDIGPAGGFIFYDKGSYSDGWRYLEAAPASTEWTGIEWGSCETFIGGTGTGIGTGQSNTTKIVTWLNNHSETNRAAQLCNALVYGGYSDWFLPSKGELNLIYTNLKVYSVGGFFDGPYWSSSEYSEGFTWYQNLTNGFQGHVDKDDYFRVRAARAF